MKTCISTLLLLLSCICSAQDLIYTPKNPAFGGDTFNYQWLLNSANAQNMFTEDQKYDYELSDLDLFTERLNNKILDNIAGQLFEDQFDNGLLNTGTSSFGSLELEVYESSQGLVINILDISTGEQTQIIIPN